MASPCPKHKGRTGSSRRTIRSFPMDKPRLHGCMANQANQDREGPPALMKTQSVLLRSGLRLFGTSTLRRCLLAGRRLLRGVRPWQR